MRMVVMVMRAVVMVMRAVLMVMRMVAMVIKTMISVFPANICKCVICLCCCGRPGSYWVSTNVYVLTLCMCNIDCDRLYSAQAQNEHHMKCSLLLS